MGHTIVVTENDSTVVRYELDARMHFWVCARIRLIVLFGVPFEILCASIEEPQVVIRLQFLQTKLKATHLNVLKSLYANVCVDPACPV